MNYGIMIFLCASSLEIRRLESWIQCHLFLGLWINLITPSEKIQGKVTDIVINDKIDG